MGSQAAFTINGEIVSISMFYYFGMSKHYFPIEHGNGIRCKNKLSCAVTWASLEKGLFVHLPFIFANLFTFSHLILSLEVAFGRSKSIEFVSIVDGKIWASP